MCNKIKMEATPLIIIDIWVYLITHIITDFETLLNLKRVNKESYQLVTQCCTIYKDIKDSFTQKKNGVYILDPNRDGRNPREILCNYQMTRFTNLDNGNRELSITLIMINQYYEILFNYALNSVFSLQFKLAIKDSLILSENNYWNLDFREFIKSCGSELTMTPELSEDSLNLNRIFDDNVTGWERSWIDYFITKKRRVFNQIHFNIVKLNE